MEDNILASTFSFFKNRNNIYVNDCECLFVSSFILSYIYSLLSTIVDTQEAGVIYWSKFWSAHVGQKFWGWQIHMWIAYIPNFMSIGVTVSGSVRRSQFLLILHSKIFRK